MADAERVARQKKDLVDLKETRGWTTLREVMGEKLEKHKARIGALVLARETQTVTQREIDYLAGYWDAVNAILNAPERADRTLDRALEKADLLKEADPVV